MRVALESNAFKGISIAMERSIVSTGRMSCQSVFVIRMDSLRVIKESSAFQGIK